jgi:DNA ligase-1
MPVVDVVDVVGLAVGVVEPAVGLVELAVGLALEAAPGDGLAVAAGVPESVGDGEGSVAAASDCSCVDCVATTAPPNATSAARAAASGPRSRRMSHSLDGTGRSFDRNRRDVTLAPDRPTGSIGRTGRGSGDRDNGPMLLADVAAASRDIASSASRLAKVSRLAAVLRSADPDEVPIVVPWLSGELRQRRTGVGWATLRAAPPPAAEATLTVRETDAVFETVSALAGAGSAGERRRLVHALFGRATDVEQALLRGLVSGELRQGALEGVMLDAVARAAGVPAGAVRRAAMLCGAIAPVAVAALTAGEAAMREFGLQVGRPLLPMLASTAESVTAGLEQLGEVSVDTKLDGIRIQVHRDGDDVSVYSRSLDDITPRVPEVVAAALALPASAVVLDGEALALRDDGRPRPFQETGARAATRGGRSVALSMFAFDVLHVDGDDLIDRPLSERQQVLTSLVPAGAQVARVTTGDPAAAERFLAGALEAGHEGVVLKGLQSTYDAGRRGSVWLKVKPVHTLDLVVLAAEWGHGRRQGWLSNLHLGARDAGSGQFVMLGKTFKGMTDDLLRWQTARFLELETSRTDHIVHVRPEQVVEIGFDGVQRSPRYPGGVALRFARVLRYRDDKRAKDADTIDTVRAYLHR